MSETSQESGEEIEYLSFDEFCSRFSNNTYLFFTSGELGDEYRKTPQYKKLLEVNSELVQKLFTALKDASIFYRDGKRLPDNEAFQPYYQDLYNVYIIMRNAGFSDDDILL
ncbi:MAG: hypothetical protein WC659_00340 [Patescibacteria group bacterium]